MPGPNNLYGVSNPLPLPQFIFTAVNTTFPAGVETVIFQTTALTAPSTGVFYPVVFAEVQLAMGATPPSGVILSIRLSTGSDMQGTGLAAFQLVASQQSMSTLLLTGLPSQTAYAGAGSILQLTANPTGQPITGGGPGSYMQVFLFRAPDQ